MKKVNKNDKKFRIFKLSNIFFVIMLSYFINTLVEQQTTLNKYNSQIEAYEMQISLKKENLSLYTNDKENESTNEYIEKVARESLGLVKPYETIYIDISK